MEGYRIQTDTPGNRRFAKNCLKDGWLKTCKKLMMETFPREDPFSILVPVGFDIHKHHGPMRPDIEVVDVLLRVDFVREVDVFLEEVRSQQEEAMTTQALDPESVGSRLKW